MDNHQPLCWSGATSGSCLLLAWRTSMGFAGRRSHYGLRQLTWICADSDHRSNETENSFTGLKLKKVFLCSHSRIFVWLSNYMCISQVWAGNFYHEIQIQMLTNRSWHRNRIIIISLVLFKFCLISSFNKWMFAVILAVIKYLAILSLHDQFFIHRGHTVFVEKHMSPKQK